MNKTILALLASAFIFAGCKSADRLYVHDENRLAGKHAYSVMLMSDTHYDKRKYNTGTKVPSYWDSDTAKSYGMWDNGYDSISYPMLRLMSVVKGNAKFILHAGDIIMGDADSEITAAAQMNDALNEISGIVGLPVYATMDNHDLCRTTSLADPGRFPTYSTNMDDMGCTPTCAQRCLNAKAATNAINAYAAKNLNYEKLDEHYFMTKTYEGDLYIFTQASNDGLQYLANELMSHPQENYRYTFVIIHMSPILGKNYGDQKPWQNDAFSYYKHDANGKHQLIQRNEALKQQIISNLAARDAIIFPGHKHYWEMIDAKFSEGTIHQFMCNSNDVSFKWLPCENFSEWAIHAAADPGTIFNDGGASEISKYLLWSDRGFAKLFITDDSIEADIYSANTGTCIKTIKIK